jgi:hypothetical protein
MRRTREQPVERERELLQSIGRPKCFALHIPQHQEAASVCLSQPVNPCDIGVVQGCQELCLSLKAGHSLRITGKGLGEELEAILRSRIVS